MSVQPDSNGEGGPPPSHTRGEAASGWREYRAARESWMGWEVCSIRDDSLAIILLSPATKQQEYSLDASWYFVFKR